MHHGGLMAHMGQSKRVTFEDLKKELDSIRRDMNVIKDMEVSEELKPPILKELQAQANEVKEKMHDLIDVL